MAQLLFPLILLAAMWFVMIRPQKERLRLQRELLASVASGDRVVVAGMIGTVRDVDGDEINVEIAPGTVVRFKLGAVNQRLTETTES